MTSVPSDVQAVVWRLAVDLEMGAVEPEGAVRVACQLVEMGVDDEAAIALAVMPSDLRRLRVDDVEPLARTLVANLGVALPTSEQAGWATAAFIAEAMIEGAVAPVVGASRVWRLWEQCGDQAGVLTWMLQLTDAWEQTVGGDERAKLEQEMVAYAAVVRDAAANRLASLSD